MASMSFYYSLSLSPVPIVSSELSLHSMYIALDRIWGLTNQGLLIRVHEEEIWPWAVYS